MLKCNAEFDNKIASGLSPIEFLNQKVFKDNVILRSYDDKTNTSIFDVFINIGKGEPISIMEIKLKNLRQI